MINWAQPQKLSIHRPLQTMLLIKSLVYKCWWLVAFMATYVTYRWRQWPERAAAGPDQSQPPSVRTVLLQAPSNQIYVNAQTRYAMVWLFTLTDVIRFALTNDTGADDGVDEVEGSHGQGAPLLLCAIMRRRQLVQVALRRLRAVGQLLLSTAPSHVAQPEALMYICNAMQRL